MIFLVLIYVGMIFIDLSLSLIFGSIALSPMFLIAPVLFIIILIKNRFKYFRNYESDLFLFYFLSSFFVSIILAIYYFLTNDTLYTPYNQFIPIKLVNASIYNLIYFFTYYVLLDIFLKKDTKYISRSFLIALIVLIAIGTIEFINKDLLDLFHNIQVEYDRLRLTTAEPSRAFVVIIIFAFLTISVQENKVVKVIIFIIAIIFSMFIASKGGLIFLFISIGLIYLFETTIKQKILFLIILLPIVILSIYIFINILLPAILIDIERFSSISTRSITSFWAILSLLYFPFGEGYGTYMCYFKDILNISIKVVSYILPFPLSLVEIDDMVDTGINVGVKSGILFQIVQNGFLAVIFFYLLFKKAYLNISLLNISFFDKNILKFIIIFDLLSILFTANIEVLYVYILPIVYINALKIKNERVITP